LVVASTIVTPDPICPTVYVPPTGLKAGVCAALAGGAEPEALAGCLSGVTWFRIGPPALGAAEGLATEGGETRCGAGEAIFGAITGAGACGGLIITPSVLLPSSETSLVVKFA
jgi:hypothetical protein